MKLLVLHFLISVDQIGFSIKRDCIIVRTKRVELLLYLRQNYVLLCEIWLYLNKEIPYVTLSQPFSISRINALGSDT